MSLIAGVLACLPAAGLAAPALAETPLPPSWISLSGSGLISLPDTSTLERGRFNVGLAIDNQDRDPLRMDILDLSAAWIVGLGPRLETYGHAVVSRAVTVSPRPALFPSPIDLIVPADHTIPERPYHPFYDAFPYVNKTGRSQLGQLTPGDAVVGVKRAFGVPRGLRPGLALSAEVKIPLSWGLADLQTGSGTGKIDERARVTTEWRTAGRSLVTSVAYTHRGQPKWGDRVIVFDPAGGVKVTEMPLRLANEVNLGLGFRQVLTPRVALAAELTKAASVGGHTPEFRVAGPVDVSAGAQLRWRGATVNLCARWHANSVPPLTHIAWPLGGLADVTEVSQADLAAYLGAIGAQGVIPFLRHRSQSALALPANGPPLPPGTKMLPEEFTVRPHDRFAYVVIFGWTFGKADRR